MKLSCTHLQTGIRDKSSIFSLCIKISKMRLTQKQLTHTGELRHWFSWRKHPLKCWNYVLIFFLSFALMPLGNCVLLLLNWTVRVSRCLGPAFFTSGTPQSSTASHVELFHSHHVSGLILIAQTPWPECWCESPAFCMAAIPHCGTCRWLHKYKLWVLDMNNCNFSFNLILFNNYSLHLSDGMKRRTYLWVNIIREHLTTYGCCPGNRRYLVTSSACPLIMFCRKD